MTVGDFKKAPEVFRRIRSTFHRKKIDDLNKEFGMTFACFSNRLDQLFQSGQKSIVADSQEWSAGNIANAGGFNNQRAGSSCGESSIPVEAVLSDKTIFRRAPRHHRRHPGAAFQPYRANLNWFEKKRLLCLFRRGPTSFRNRMLDWV